MADVSIPATVTLVPGYEGTVILMTVMMVFSHPGSWVRIVGICIKFMEKTNLGELNCQIMSLQT